MGKSCMFINFCTFWTWLELSYQKFVITVLKIPRTDSERFTLFQTLVGYTIHFRLFFPFLGAAALFLATTFLATFFLGGGANFLGVGAPLFLGLGITSPPSSSSDSSSLSESTAALLVAFLLKIEDLNEIPSKISITWVCSFQLSPLFLSSPQKTPPKAPQVRDSRGALNGKSQRIPCQIS